MHEQLKIGQYTLVRKIGQGGMAEVWEARHVHLGNRAAVKFLFPEFGGNQELQERFLNEGKRQAQLQHPNIVPAMDFLLVEGRSYLVMQYVEGQSLETRLQEPNPPLSLEEIHTISWDVLSALDYAHSLGVVHRDVKPANILLDKSGRTLLTDFGIAKALREEGSVTLTGTSMGTPDYMSPEQILQPKLVDARSDVYSFGCVLYAMLSGSPPFSSEGATAFYIQDRHVRAAPPPLVYRNSDVPPAVGDVALKCLEKDPAQRFQSCGLVITTLDAAITGKVHDPSPPAPPAVPAKSFKKYIVAGVAAIAVLAGLVYFLSASKKDPDLERLLRKSWVNVPYNDRDFSDPNCMQDPECKARKAQAEELIAVKDWHQLPYDSPFFKDCMNYQPCLDGKVYVDRLLAVHDWSHADQQLMSDCMSYPPCVQAKKISQVKPAVKKPAGDGTENSLPDCCKNASNPAACRKTKTEMGIHDCTSPTDQ